MEYMAGGERFRKDYAFRQARDEPAQYASKLSDHYRRLGLGGDISLSEEVLPMHGLLSLGYGSHIAVRLTEDQVRTQLLELFADWAEFYDAKRRAIYRIGVDNLILLNGRTVETGSHGAISPPEDFTRLADAYSRTGVGGGVLAHLVLAAYDLLGLEADRNELLEIAMGSVRRHLAILALQWQRTLEMDTSLVNRMKGQALLFSTESSHLQLCDERLEEWANESPAGSGTAHPGHADGHICRDGEKGES